MNSYSAFRKSIDRIRGVTHTLDTHVSVDRLKLKQQFFVFYKYQRCTKEIQERFDTRKIFGYKDSYSARSTLSSDTMVSSNKYSAKT